MKPIIVFCLLLFLTDKIFLVDNSNLSLGNGNSASINDFRNRRRFTKKIWVLRRRTPSNIINADNRRNSTKSTKVLKCGTPEVIPNFNLNDSGRIINGKTAFPNSWPWLVSIRQSKNSNLYHICAGSLISAQHVLTAAHCVSDFRNNTFAVVIGINKLSESITLENTYLIIRYVIHPGFQPTTLKNDIAILHLNLPVKFSKTILPICLPLSSKKEFLYEKEVVVIGWYLEDIYYKIFLHLDFKGKHKWLQLSNNSIKPTTSNNSANQKLQK